MGQFRVVGKVMPLLTDLEPSPVEFNPRLATPLFAMFCFWGLRKIASL